MAPKETRIQIVATPEFQEKVDAWRARRKLNRSEAIRLLVLRGMDAPGPFILPNARLAGTPQGRLSKPLDALTGKPIEERKPMQKAEPKIGRSKWK